MEFLKKTMRGYNFVFNELSDERTRGWFLVGKPYQGLMLLGLYLMFVKKWGPQWMKNRPAFKVKKAIIVYNVIQIILCVILFVNALKFWGWGGSYKWVCEPVDSSNRPDALAITKLVYFYYMLKIIDLLDTVFFILRKKFNQASFLHIYHHTGMVMLIWGAVTYFPGGHGTFVGVVNSFVHALMYTYYLLTITFPSIRNKVWAKQLVTSLQIVQFFSFIVHIGILIFKTDCEYPRWVAAVFLPQNIFMIILFIDFYIKSYIRKPKNEKIKLKSDVNNGDCTNSDSKLCNGNIAGNGVIKKENGNGRIEYLTRKRYEGSSFTDRNADRTL